MSGFEFSLILLKDHAVTNHYLVLSISPSLSARRRRSRADVEGGAYEPLIEGGVLRHLLRII